MELLAKGFNEAIRKVTKDTVILYSTTLSLDRVLKLKTSPHTVVLINKTGAEIGEKFYKPYCINTMLVNKDYEKTNIL